MQCFQKDPNLRVTARKLLRHAWIAGSRRAEAPVSKAPANFNQAVEEVKQWNKALNSDSNLRTSTGSDFIGPSSRFTGGTPARGPLSLAKSRPSAEAFKSAEVAGKLHHLKVALWTTTASFARSVINKRLIVLQMMTTGTMTSPRQSLPVPSSYPISSPKITLVVFSRATN